MAEGKKSFILYCDWWDWIECLTQEQKAQWVDWLFAYVRDLKPDMPKDQALMMVCKYTKSQLKEDLVKYENKVKSIENARKSNRNHIENKLKSNCNQLEIDSVNVNDNVNVNVNDNDICVNTHNNNACMREEENISTLQNLIQEIEKRFNRVLTIYETTTIQDLAKSFTATQILDEIEKNMDKEKPINYIKSKLEHATIQIPIKEEEPKVKTYEFHDWAGAFKVYYDEEAPQHIRDKAKAYMEGK